MEQGWGVKLGNRLHGRKNEQTQRADLTRCIYPKLCLTLTFFLVALHSNDVIGMFSCVTPFACLNMHDVNMSLPLSGLSLQHLEGCNHF